MKKSTKTWWLVTPYVLLMILGAFLGIRGYVDAESTHAPALIATGVLTFAVALGLLPIALASAGQSGKMTKQLGAHMEGQAETLTQIHEHTMLSDSAKRIAYRREEREMLRRAIEEDIAHEDWEAASVLVMQMSEHFGYMQEAEEFRRHIEESRADAQNARLREAVQRCEALIGARQWTAAYAEAARIKRMFPDAPHVQELDQGVRAAWQDYKHALERQFLEAAGADDIDEAMEILRELDAYLTPREAEPYQEIARGVIGKARDNLGLQFKLAIKESDWTRAVVVGEEIMDEFPNTVMAREVRERIDVLRSRMAENAAGAAAPSQAQSAAQPHPQSRPSPIDEAAAAASQFD